MNSPPPPTLEERRQIEIAKYERCYKHDSYQMGRDRVREWADYLVHARRDPKIRCVLDVGCGRAESLNMALDAGLEVAHGCEVVDDLVGGRVMRMEGIHYLPVPDTEYDLVSCQDVLEHVLEDDVPAGLRELVRVAKRRIYISVAWFSSTWRKAGVHEELHVCRHETQWWLDQITAAAGDQAWGGIHVLKPYRPSTARFEVVLGR